ncbi:KptA family-domain-containing protein [Mycena polygramma]|nr:KptA family-domain-containing protein [Mycena polygramma]
MNFRGPLAHHVQASTVRRFQSSAQRAPQADEFGLFTRRLHWLLRYGAMPPLMTIRPDGFVRLSDIRNHSLFRNLSQPDFNALLERDESKRFKIVQDYDLRVGTEALWIRARKGHAIPAVDLTVKRVLSPNDFSAATYQAVDLQTWTNASHYGIHPSPTDNLIHLLPTPANHNFSHLAGNFCIFLDVAKMLAAGIQLFRTTRGTVLTTGDANGVLPPHMFEEVISVQLEREERTGTNIHGGRMGF